MYEASNQSKASPGNRLIAALASLELTVAAIVLLVLFVLAGAWIPQKNSIDEAALMAKYGTDGLALLRGAGLLDIYRSPPLPLDSWGALYQPDGLYSFKNGACTKQICTAAPI